MCLKKRRIRFISRICPGAPLGRPIGDVSRGDGALNDKEGYVRDIGRQRAGTLTHPGIDNFSEMVQNARIHYRTELLNGDELIMGKIDIKDAFMKLHIAPESVRKVGFRLSDDLYLFYLTGFFGWTSFPHYFGVITRILKKLAVIKGILFLQGYVDDYTIFTLRSRIEKEMAIYIDLCTLLLGNGCINEKKTITARVMDNIGWTIDLTAGPLGDDGHPEGTVALSEKNLDKLLYALFFEIPDVFFNTDMFLRSWVRCFVERLRQSSLC
jgi:hypothetical protein